MQRACGSRGRRQLFAGFKLLRLAALNTHSSSRGLIPTIRDRAAGSLPVQKSQSSDRTARGRRMAFGIDSHLVGGSGFLVRGSVSTKVEKVFGRKLVAQSVERDRNLQETQENLDWKYSLKENSDAVVRTESNAASLEFVARETGDRTRSIAFDPVMSSTSGSSDMGLSNRSGDMSTAVRVSEALTSQMNLATADSILEQVSRSRGVTNSGVRGAMQHSPVEEGVPLGFKQALGSAIGRQLTSRTSSEHKLRAVYKGAVKTVDMESGNAGVEGDILDRVENLRQVIADYSYRYHTLDNPVVR